jgi:hypothetical protein
MIMRKKNYNSPDGFVQVDKALMDAWKPAFEAYLGADKLSGVSESRMRLMTGIAASKFAELSGHGNMIGTEADMAIMSSDNTGLAPNVVNPVASGTGLNSTSTKGSADRQFLVGICVAIAGKTIGLDLVQSVPATSANVTVKYLNVVYNGGDLNNAANDTVKVVTVGFDKAPNLVAGGKYVIGHKQATGENYEFIELTYVKPDRKGPKFAVFTVGNAFTATKNENALTAVTYVTAGPAIGAVAADGAVYGINSDMDTLTPLASNAAVESVANTKAVENYIPHQTTKGLHRTLTRSEADAGTEHKIELELESDAHVIGNRVFVGNISRLNYKRIAESGIDPIPFLTAAQKNEISQEINYDIISAERAYGITNALEYAIDGMNFNTFVAPKSVTSIPFANLPYANELRDKDGNEVAAQFGDIKNLMTTMEFETVASIGTYLCMLIEQASYAIGTDSRFGEADAVILSAGLAGYAAASSKFTKLSDKDIDFTASTGAKLSGTIGGIKVYVDVQSPMASPYVTVVRTNQDVKVDVPGVDTDNVLVPGLAYLVKDLVSEVTLVPSGTGGQKIIMDSETDLCAVGETAHKAYLTFAFYVQVPGLNA